MEFNRLTVDRNRARLGPYMETGCSRQPVVLVVEDHEDSRTMYCQFLESVGYSALGAANGQEGLLAVREHAPDVVVTDISMPGMDGWRFARELREGYANLGIIAVSGWASDETLQTQARQARVDVVMSKPCLPEELLLAIRRLLARGRLARLRASTQLAKARELRARSDRLIERAARHQKARNGDDR